MKFYMSDEDKNYTLTDFLRFGVKFIILMLIIFFILKYVGQRTNVSGDSMYPTLEDGDSLILDKLSYRFSDVERFDIVVFPYYDSSTGEESMYIKRIIGMPDEVIRMEDGNIYIDDEILEDPYGYFEPGKYPYSGLADNDGYYIEDGTYFVLGDNRNISEDSRMFGSVKEEDIEGRIIFRMFPFDKIGGVE